MAPFNSYDRFESYHRLAQGCGAWPPRWRWPRAGGVQAQNCTFRTAGSPINFPALDPSAADDRHRVDEHPASAALPPASSPTWGFSGANGSAPLRMKHATQNAYIPYTITATFVSGSAPTKTWRITGTLLGANYVNARVGAYSDILTATVTP